MVGKAEPTEGNAAQIAAIRDLGIAASHLQRASAALDSAQSSVAAAYVEQALWYCRLELAKYEPTISSDSVVMDERASPFPDPPAR